MFKLNPTLFSRSMKALLAGLFDSDDFFIYLSSIFFYSLVNDVDDVNWWKVSTADIITCGMIVVAGVSSVLQGHAPLP